MTDKQIQVTYKETSLGFTVLNGETNIHTEDANLLLQQGWFAASMLLPSRQKNTYFRSGSKAIAKAGSARKLSINT